jgi:hypothetical protein
MMDKSKRQFFKQGLLKQVAEMVAGFQEGMEKADRRDEFERFFESDESCYALTLAYPDELLLETAKLHGIPTEGRNKKEIVRELFLKKGGDEYRF